MKKLQFFKKKTSILTSLPSFGKDMRNFYGRKMSKQKNSFFDFKIPKMDFSATLSQHFKE